MSKPHINVTPLIDVLLVLLIIFMVITPMKPTSFETRIPQEPKSDPTVKAHPDTIVVEVGIDSSLKLNQSEFYATVQEPEHLTATLRAFFSQREQNLNSERTVFIKAPKQLNYGTVVEVVDAVKAAGAHPISLQIDQLDRGA